MSESKREKLDDYIRRCVAQGIREYAVSNNHNPDTRSWLAANERGMSIYVGSVVTEKYRMLELCDIIEWKNRPHP